MRAMRSRWCKAFAKCRLPEGSPLGRGPKDRASLRRPQQALTRWSARQLEQAVVRLEAFFFSKCDNFLFAENLGSDNILAPEFLTLDDPVVDRAVGLSKELSGLTGDARADRRNVLLGKSGAGKWPNGRGAAGFFTPARDRLLTNAVFFGELLVRFYGSVVRKVGRTFKDGHSGYRRSQVGAAKQFRLDSYVVGSCPLSREWAAAKPFRRRAALWASPV